MGVDPYRCGVALQEGARVRDGEGRALLWMALCVCALPLVSLLRSGHASSRELGLSAAVAIFAIRQLLRGD